MPEDKELDTLKDLVFQQRAIFLSDAVQAFLKGPAHRLGVVFSMILIDTVGKFQVQVTRIKSEIDIILSVCHREDELQ